MAIRIIKKGGATMPPPAAVVEEQDPNWRSKVRYHCRECGTPRPWGVQVKHCVEDHCPGTYYD